MSTNLHPVPELAALAAGALEKELAELPDHPTQEQLEAARKRLNLPGLESLEVRPHALIGGEPCEPSDEVLGLEKAAGQKIQKVILLVRPTPRGCRETILRVATIFTGYGAYTLSFWKKATASEPDLFAGFFGDIAAPRGTGSRPGANLHRTILFQREGTEGIPADHQQLLLTPALDVSAAYLTNLVRFVDVAAARDVVVQVCLFNYHGVTGAGGIQPPTHFTFTDTDPGVRFRKFFKVGGQYQSFQANLIAKVAQALSGRWNVIWEVGNELRIPGSETSDYHNSDLTAWIAWVAQAIRQKAPQLISTSTGILTGGGVPNEQPVNQLPGLNYAAFHYGQWKTDIPGAVNRAAGYSDRHVVLDTDGSNGALVASQVQSFATQALSGTLKYRASFDHKGSTPVAIYDPSWLNQGDAGKKPVESSLTALANARAATDTIGWGAHRQQRGVYRNCGFWQSALSVARQRPHLEVCRPPVDRVADARQQPGHPADCGVWRQSLSTPSGGPDLEVCGTTDHRLAGVGPQPRHRTHRRRWQRPIPDARQRAHLAVHRDADHGLGRARQQPGDEEDRGGWR